MGAWLDRSAALAKLGVRAQTLYAYVSRGRIGMRPDPADPRRSLYNAEDVDALLQRRARGRRPAAIAESTIAWGEPSIATSISTVLHGRLIYRGIDAVDFAERATLEDAAALLWSAEGPVDLDGRAPLARSAAGATARSHGWSGARPDNPEGHASGARAAAFEALALLAARTRPTLGRPAAMLRTDAAEAVATLATALCAGDPLKRGGRREPVHRRVAHAWSLDRSGTDVVRRALVLLTDHELNASTFATRVAASTGASVAASLLAGLAALSGPRHGGAAEAVAALADDAARLGAEAAVTRWLGREAALPGFDHPLYPQGDPRARSLLAALEIDPVLGQVADAVAAATGGLPNVDFALLALVRAIGLPDDAPFRLFALGRSVGWAAHAIEQVTTGSLIRPRARYQGPLPAEG